MRIINRYDLISGTTPLAVGMEGTGRTFLLLHSGAGPVSMKTLAVSLASRAYVILPTMPGFDGEPRPAWLKTISDIATLYLVFLEQIGANDVTIIGNSVGGWIAAEMALRGSPRVRDIVLIDAIGLNPSEEGGRITDPIKLGPAVADYAFHDPQRFGTPLDQATAERTRRNQQVLQTYASDPYMNDPSLRGRLPDMPVASLVLWGESDRIVTPAYGRQFANLMPGARFELIPEAGHFPQIEQLERVVAKLDL